MKKLTWKKDLEEYTAHDLIFRMGIKIPLICISGATATGKSSLALSLAESLGGEIINADAMQVYSGFDIGCAKVGLKEQRGIPHHLLSHVEANEQYSAGRFKKEAISVAEKIFTSGKVPIVVGGSGMYISALCSGFLGLYDTSKQEAFLDSLRNRLGETKSETYFWQLLKALDLNTANKLPPQDYVRVQRALKLVLHTGVPLAFLKSRLNEHDPRLDVLVFVVDRDTESLYPRINSRVEDMISTGWIEEVKKLLSKHHPDAPAFKAIGYSHILKWLENGSKQEDLSILIKKIQRDTRRFAKRQRTWWRHQPSKLQWKERSLAVSTSASSSSRSSSVEEGSSMLENQLSEILAECKNFLAKYKSNNAIETEGSSQPRVFRIEI